MDLLAAAAYFFLDSSESETDEEIVLDDAEIADNTPKVEPLEGKLPTIPKNYKL